jgi:hypothetical protein
LTPIFKIDTIIYDTALLATLKETY